MENKRKLFLFFVIKYFSVVLLFYIIILFIKDNLLKQYLESIALLASNIIGLFDKSIVHNGSRISNDFFSIQISFGCDGSEAMMLLLAGIVAYKTEIRKKLFGLILGLITIFLLNLLRIVALFYIGYSDIDLFNSFHLTYFPILFIIIPIVMFLIWIDYVKKQKT